MAFPIAAILGIGAQLIDKLIPDPQQAAAAKAELVRLEQQGDLKELEVRMSAIVMEAKSSDPWTSRARPSFLYVVYVILLTSLPMGVLSAISPETSANIVAGFRAWLAAIPAEMWSLFGVGYLGYVTGRSYDKKKLLETK